MTSYFVAADATAPWEAAVHDRNRCPPERFPLDRSEYLGEFLEAAQAVAVARLRYANACRCGCCDAEALPALTLPADAQALDLS